MKKLTGLLFLIVSFQLKAQKSIDGLINAEKSFAAYAVAHGTKDAFLKFLDSNGVVFEQGKAVNGIETWSKRDARPGVLNWQPQFAEVASSNDFGYTTGPWTFQPKSSNDSIVARGQYFTVWHADKNNDWKFLTDIGINNTPAGIFTTTKKIEAKKITGEAAGNSLAEAEQKFVAEYEINKSKAYQKFLSNKTILLRNGRLAATSVDDQLVVIKNTPSHIQYTVTGSGIALTGDLAYVYGNTLIDGKSENYLRIWRKEKQGWKIAAEVLRY